VPVTAPLQKPPEAQPHVQQTPGELQGLAPPAAARQLTRDAVNQLAGNQQAVASPPAAPQPAQQVLHQTQQPQAQQTPGQPSPQGRQRSSSGAQRSEAATAYCMVAAGAPPSAPSYTGPKPTALPTAPAPALLRRVEPSEAASAAATLVLPLHRPLPPLPLPTALSNVLGVPAGSFVVGTMGTSAGGKLLLLSVPREESPGPPRQLRAAASEGSFGQARLATGEGAGRGLVPMQVPAAAAAELSSLETAADQTAAAAAAAAAAAGALPGGHQDGVRDPEAAVAALPSAVAAAGWPAPGLCASYGASGVGSANSNMGAAGRGLVGALVASKTAVVRKRPPSSFQASTITGAR
jgi:hypothetical protein